MILASISRQVYKHGIFQELSLKEELQRFFQEAVAWRHLRHPNILPLLGVNPDLKQHRLAMISEWMVCGNINEFIESSEGVNRIQLVSSDAISLDNISNLLF